LADAGGRHYNCLVMPACVSIAIETSCRRGGIALGGGDDLIEAAAFRADRRHAVQLVARLAELLARHGRRPGDVEHIYVSVGPGSFTGLRVGITVARTLAQAVPGAAAVAVPTVQAVAENAQDVEFDNLAVVMDAKDGAVYAGVFARRQGRIVPAGPPALVGVQTFADQCPKPITLIGEALAYQKIGAEGIAIGDESLWLPRPQGVWRVGRSMAELGQFTDYKQLLPLYLRKPEAVRLWERNRPGKK